MDTVLCDNPEVKGLLLETLRECTDLQEFGRRMLELVVNAAMSARADEVCNASWGERTPERENSRNGYRERGLATSVGDVTLRIPKLRSGTFFPDDLIERYCRVDRALVAAVAEMYVMGISTRKVEQVAGELGVKSMSKSQVSRLCGCLDAEVEAFRRQRFDGVRFAYLWLDATYVKCRVEGRSVSQAVVTAIGLDDTGHKRFVGVDCVDTESHADWKGFLFDLRSRGMDGVRLVVSDAHEGLARAIAETFQGASWQRCVTHLMRNVSGRIHKKEDQRKAREAMKAVFAQKSPVLVRACYQQATEEIAKLSRTAGSALMEAEEAALAYLAFPASHRTKIRTSNVQERANREIKRAAPTSCKGSPRASR
ncbi:IS256 family transposase [Gordonibacter massiliensis (ex Traore et al. 2017)]|uniref:IS256 family transposase n=1 Tax=Gordonibacter massiliensis (ex Traore et al. 2017) TaxID=1841863 RepID=UPI0021B070D8|nr:IS256 family transposase [Gordonibacter massiliensis (ex Traore et al. 2017)]